MEREKDACFQWDDAEGKIPGNGVAQDLRRGKHLLFSYRMATMRAARVNA